MNVRTCVKNGLPVLSAAIVLFVTYALIASNPGLYWDDWVWPTQSQTESILIGRQLGVWWAGYFNNWIYSIPAFPYVFRAIAIGGWILSAAAISYILHANRILRGGMLWVAFVLLGLFSPAFFRNINSVAMYNAYIACFWCGCAIAQRFGLKSIKAYIAIPLFMFSFYLNSLVVMYGGFLLILLFPAVRSIGFKIPEKGISAIKRQFIFGVLNLKNELVGRVAEYRIWVWGSLPFVFAGIRSLTTVKSDLYGTYNSFNLAAVGDSIFKSGSVVSNLLREFWAVLWKNDPREQSFVIVLVCILVIRSFWNGRSNLNFRSTVSLFLVGFGLAYMGVVPYVIVGKTPALVDLYETRHTLLAAPGLVLLALALLNFISLLGCKIELLSAWIRIVGGGVLIGLSVSYGISFGVGMWWDWLRQESFIEELQANRDVFEKYSMILVRDYSGASVYRSRKIWNYEYTGAELRVFPDKSHMAVDVEEYGAWEVAEKLISDTKLRRRYNIENVDFKRPHAILSILNQCHDYTLDTLVHYLSRRVLRENAVGSPYSDCVKYSIAEEFTEVDKHVNELFRAKKILLEYYAKYGAFPKSDGSKFVKGAVVTHEVTYRAAHGVEVAPPASVGGIPGIKNDQWQVEEAETVQTKAGIRGFIYWSDGVDYKLSYLNAPDYAYAKQAYPYIIDPARESYGVWSEGGYAW